MLLYRFLEFLRKFLKNLENFKGPRTNSLRLLSVAQKGRYPVRSIKVDFKVGMHRSDVRRVDPVPSSRKYEAAFLISIEDFSLRA